MPIFQICSHFSNKISKINFLNCFGEIRVNQDGGKTKWPPMLKLHYIKIIRKIILKNTFFTDFLSYPARIYAK